MTKVTWDLGTAYDLFMSLEVLHNPSDFGLRAAWAAGMRSRLPALEREVLEATCQLSICVPLHWIHALPEPKDSATALGVLEDTPVAERLPRLALSPYEEDEMHTVLRRVAARGRWEEDEEELLRAKLREKKGKAKNGADPEIIIKWWSRAEEFGERYPEALRAYYEVFFAEEERRIQPALVRALEEAQELAKELEAVDLMEELSQGVRSIDMMDADELVLAPSYWSTPLVVFEGMGPKRWIALFGARPLDASLVPGELVPDTLLRGLKALSDPTRLRILRYLSAGSLTPTQLARRLRLRPPTVIHHLQALRLAGLVQLTVDAAKERRYAARHAAVENTFSALTEFLQTRERAQEPPDGSELAEADSD